MRFGPREIVIILVLMGIPVVSWWTAFRPQNAHCVEMRQQIEAKQAKLQELNRATANIGDLRQRIEKLQTAMRFFRSKLPSQKEIDKVLKEVSQLAEINRLKTKEIRTLERRESTASGATSTEHAEEPIRVHLEGDFLGFYSFLQALENQPRIMRIRSMTLDKCKKGPPGHMSAELIMIIFFEGPGRGTG